MVEYFNRGLRPGFDFAPLHPCSNPLLREDIAMPLRLTLTGLASQYIHMPLAPFCLKKAVEASGLPVSTCCSSSGVSGRR